MWAPNFIDGGMTMGLLVDYMNQFVAEASKTKGIISRKTISEWFGNKQAVKRDGYKDVMSFDTKAAIVVVGVSCIGKSTYIQNFLNLYPHIKLISYDEAGYKKAQEEMEGKVVSETRIFEIIEEEILENKEKSIIVDSTFIQPYSRAALMRFLADLGYEIHMLYFSKEYTEAHITVCLLNRAIEITLYEDYLKKIESSKMDFRERLEARKGIFERYAREHAISVEELKSRMVSHPTTITTLQYLANCYRNEVEEHRVWWQEKRGLFFLGADYCYIL